MKYFSTFLLIFLFNSQFSFSQHTLVLQPGPKDGKDALLHGLDYLIDENLGWHKQFTAMSWTFNGVPGNIRSVIEFDLSQLPENAKIDRARLSLYAYDSQNSLGQHSCLSGSNESWLRRIVTEWDEEKVTWNTQPLTTKRNQINLFSTNNPNQNYLRIDVTQLIKDMIYDPENSHGFMIQLNTEEYYRSMNFASSDHHNQSLHPRLEINYSIETPIEDTCYVIQPSARLGKDAVLHGLESHANINLGNHMQIPSMSWTFGGVPGNLRGLVEFDLPIIINDKEITGAYLSLYAYDAQDALGQHSTLSGPNESWIQRVITEWDEQKVTWNTQPKTTTKNQVNLHSSSYETEDYLDIDVTELVLDMYKNPNESFGFMIRLDNESYYRRLNFASSDHWNSQLHPKLEICYKTINNENETSTSEPEDQFINVYPNPAKSDLNIIINIAEEISSFSIYNIQGQAIYLVDNPNELTQIDVNSWSKGLYLVKFLSEKKTTIKRFVIN